MNYPKHILDLSNKLNGYLDYTMPFDRFELIQLVKIYMKPAYTEDFYKIINSKDFYLNVLFHCHKVSELGKIDMENLLRKIELYYNTRIAN